MKPYRPKKGDMSYLLANIDRFTTSKHSDGGMHEFNLAHYDVVIDGGWVRLKMKPATLKKTKT